MMKFLISYISLYGSFKFFPRSRNIFNNSSKNSELSEFVYSAYWPNKELKGQNTDGFWSGVEF